MVLPWTKSFMFTGNAILYHFYSGFGAQFFEQLLNIGPGRVVLKDDEERFIFDNRFGKFLVYSGIETGIEGVLDYFKDFFAYNSS